MKKINSISFFLFIAVFFIHAAASGQNLKKYKPPIQNPYLVKTQTREIAAGCATAVSQTELNINNVRAIIGNDGQNWSGRPGWGYEIPKVEPGQSSVHIFYAGGIWIGGLDAGKNLKIAAQSYHESNSTDFWPGPLSQSGEIDAFTCKSYDKNFIVLRSEIESFKEDASDGKFDFIVPPNIMNWPGKENPSLSFVGNYNLAPFVDVDKDGKYNPGNIVVITDSVTQNKSYQVDYPTLDPQSKAKPDQMIWSVFNDGGNIHSQSGGNPIGLEVQQIAFSFNSNDDLNNMTFYKYNIINKATSDLDSTFMGNFAESDMGEYTDDFVACDTVRSMAIIYNGDAIDGPGSIPNYGNQPAIAAIDFFQGPKNQSGVQLGMSSFVYFDYNPGPTGQPVISTQFYGYLSGTWADGTPFTCGGTGHGGTTNCKFIFPGDPKNSSEWSECSAGNSPGDRAILQSSGPFVLKPGAVNQIITGAVWVRPPVGSYPCPSFDMLRDADDLAQVIFDGNFEVLEGPPAPGLEVVELDRELILNIINFSNTEKYLGKSPKLTAKLKPLGLKDSFYIFEGYKIYQLKNGGINNTDVSDPEKIGDKAKLLYVIDMKDTITELYNFTQSASGEPFEKKLFVVGPNEGIQHSFRLTFDEFSKETNRTFINFTTYYFMVVPYAYNLYKKFDPLNPDSVGQENEYLEGAPAMISAIPHKTITGNLKSSYGTPFQITRIEGTGNGGLPLSLSSGSINEILNSPTYSSNNLTYEKGFGPVDVFVNNPLKVTESDFELQIVDSIYNGMLDSPAYWLLKNLTTGETVNSEFPIQVINENIIGKWGLSLKINQQFNPGNPNSKNNGAIISEIKFADRYYPWLTGVMDRDGFTYPELTSTKDVFFNWIRSGTEATDYESPNFADPNSDFENLIGGTWAPINVTARKANNNLHGPAFSDKNAVSPMNELSSVHITFTSDKSKWSKCIVVETGHNASMEMFLLRSHPSVDKNGNNETSGEWHRSWFPGYAINLETGERLNIFFGENSNDIQNNGDDMIWNPTTAFDGDAGIALGGKHYIYVLKTKYDECKQMYDLLIQNNGIPPAAQRVEAYKNVMWVSMPFVKSSFDMLPLSQGLIPNEVTVKLRVTKPYNIFYTASDSMPKYLFSTKGYSPDESVEVLKNKLDTINIVPGPYFAYSEYENDQLDNRVRITNLPYKCTITIYTQNGLLVRQMKKDNDLTYEEWDLKNKAGVPIASGVYIFHINADGIGEKVIKWFGVMRPLDLDDF